MSLTSQMPAHMPEDRFRLQSRDLYLPGGDIGMWQGALRNRDDPLRAELAAAIPRREPITVELLYSDLTGRLRAITRFGLWPPAETSEDPSRRHTAMSRLWFLDIEGPRPDNEALASVIATIQAETNTVPTDR